MTDAQTDARRLLAQTRFAFALPAVVHGVKSMVIIRGAWLVDGTCEGMIAVTPAARDDGCRAMGMFVFDPERGMEARPLAIEDDDGGAVRATYGTGIDELLQPVFRQLCDMLADAIEGHSPVTAEALAGWLGISTTAVLTHAKGGHVVKLKRGQFDLRRSIAGYCEHLRAVASGRAGEDEQLNLAQERARLAKLQADGHELKNAIARGELIEIAEAERAWADVLRAVRSTMLAVPSRVRSRLGSLSAAEAEIIDGEIRAALVESATMSRMSSGLSGTKESELGFRSGFRCASHTDAHRNIFHGLTRGSISA